MITIDFKDYRRIKKLFKQTSFRLSREILTGIHLVCEDNTLKAEATDGYVWAKVEMPCSNIDPKPDRFDVVTTLPDAPTSADSVSLTVTDAVEWSFWNSKKGTRFEGISPIIQGTYPNTAKFLPTGEPKTILEVNPDFLKAMIDTVRDTDKWNHLVIKVYEGKKPMLVIEPNRVQGSTKATGIVLSLKRERG